MIRVVSVQGVATVQDAGRPGWMHQGVPPGGALDPEGLAEANAAVGNPADAAAIELVGAMVVEGRGTVAVGGRVLEGPPWRVPASPRVRYLAVAGGLDVPVVLGGRGTLLAGGIGRALREGDELPVGRLRGHAAVPTREAGPVRVVVGPDPAAFGRDAWAVLLGAEWEVGPCDRVGARLVGPALPRRGDDAGPSMPMVRGAIQVPLGGGPLVLGPDHPVTGGYPVLAVVVRADWGRIGVAAPGDRVRFRLVARGP